MNKGPIGIFDSGIGGLTVAKEVMRQMPDESMLYFADTIHLPYGRRELDEIKSFALRIIEYLVKEGAKLIIMGCNISSGVALDDARKKFSLPIVGLVQSGVEEGLRLTRNKRIGVIATPATKKSKAYRISFLNIDPEVKVYIQACPRLVPLIEKGEIDSERTRKIAKIYLKPLMEKGIDTLILGCTHYPYLKGVLKNILGNDVKIVDPAKKTTELAKKILIENNLASPRSNKYYRYITTGEVYSLVNFGSRFLGRKIKNVKRINIFER